MGRIRDLGRKLAGRVLSPEPPVAPAPARVAPSAPARPSPPRPSSPPPRAEPSFNPADFPEECRPVTLTELALALGPAARVRVVNHWASWCEPCVEEIPLLVAIHLQLEDKADFLGVCWERFDDERPLKEVCGHVADFASNRAVRYRSLMLTCAPDELFAAFDLGTRKIPQTWVIDRAGQIVSRLEGALDEESAAALVELVSGLA